MPVSSQSLYGITKVDLCQVRSDLRSEMESLVINTDRRASQMLRVFLDFVGMFERLTGQIDRIAQTRV